MKQIQLGQFDPGRLLRYLLSRLVGAHAVEEAARKSGSGKIRRRTSSRAVLPYQRRWANPPDCRAALAIALLLNRYRGLRT